MRDTVSVNLATDDLSEVSNVYIEITDEAIKDYTGDHFQGLTGSSWNFSGFPATQELLTGAQLETSRNGSFPDFGFIRYEYSIRRSDNNQKMFCKIRYPGIQKKVETYVFPIGSKEILARLKLKRKKVRKLKRQADQHEITIDMSCADGSTDSATVNLIL